MDRRESLRKLAAAALTLALFDRELLAHAPPKTRVTVYKTSTCPCCKGWVNHARANGFDVTEVNTDELDVYRSKFKVPADLASCHTTVVGNYAFEGHVPADLIQRFLKQPPKGALGLAVPGMPIGSPGMEMGARKDPYDIVLFSANGKRTVYARR